MDYDKRIRLVQKWFTPSANECCSNSHKTDFSSSSGHCVENHMAEEEDEEDEQELPELEEVEDSDEEDAIFQIAQDMDEEYAEGFEGEEDVENIKSHSPHAVAKRHVGSIALQERATRLVLYMVRILQ
jgi:hypothetical protein